MDIELKQYTKLHQQMVMTPQLQQAIKLLQLSRLELVEKLRQELEENPVLEEVGEPEEGTEAEELKDLERRSLESMDDGPEPFVPRDRIEKPSLENFLTKDGTLSDHLMWQLRMSAMTKEDEGVGALLIGNIDEDGYLRTDMSEIVKASHSDEPTVLQVLKKIQEFDPPGVASRELKECLLIQAYHFGLKGTLTEKIILGHLKALETKNFQNIAKELNAPLEEVLEAVKIISHMEPRPGRAFGGEDPRYIIPEVFVFKDGDEYVILLNDEGIPRLRINTYYRSLLRDNSNPEAKNFVQERLRSAMWLIRSIYQRQRTIYKVTESIVKHQREFLDKGIEHLKPLVLRDVAQDVGIHESTVSRVTSNKYIHTPQGLFKMKFFFNTGINREDGQSIASESVKDTIKNIIAGEDPRKPYSDQQIVEILKGMNVHIARRTVTKYREALHTLPSSSRKKVF